MVDPSTCINAKARLVFFQVCLARDGSAAGRACLGYQASEGTVCCLLPPEYLASGTGPPSAHMS
jgi:hypothetical protein